MTAGFFFKNSVSSPQAYVQHVMRICQCCTLWLEINLIECIVYGSTVVSFCLELGLSRQHSVIFLNNNNTVVSAYF